MAVSPRDRRIVKVCSETTEPCIVFRAQDTYLPNVLDAYKDLLVAADASQDVVDAIDERRAEVVKWQEDHLDRVKVADLRPGEKTTGS